MAIKFDVTRRHIILLYAFTTFITNITPSADTPSFNSNRYKREILFRPLFVYKHRQQRYGQRMRKIKEIYLHEHYNDQQGFENYPSRQINNEFYQPFPLNQLSNAQRYDQLYYQRYHSQYYQ